MRFSAYGQSFYLQYEENVWLIPQLLRKLASEAAQESTPAGDRPAQSSESAFRTLTFRRLA